MGATTMTLLLMTLHLTSRDGPPEVHLLVVVMMVVVVVVVVIGVILVVRVPPYEGNCQG